VAWREASGDHQVDTDGRRILLGVRQPVAPTNLSRKEAAAPSVDPRELGGVGAGWRAVVARRAHTLTVGRGGDPVSKKQALRGSEKLMAAWNTRALTDDSVKEIAAALDASPAKVVGANVVGGAQPVGLTLSLAYEGDDVPWCGNDILFWLRWHINHGGGGIHPPRIIINGIPFPDLIRMELDFGHVGPGPELGGLGGELGGKLGGGVIGG
jgi:hypothetical protein